MTTNNNNNNLFGNVNVPNADLWGTAPSDPFGNVNKPVSSDPFANQPVSADPFAAAPVSKDPFAKTETKAEPEKKEETKSAGKGSVSSKASTKPANKPVALLVDPSWTIAYAGQQYNPPYEGMTLEDVRAHLETDFPELSKERTKWDTDKDKKLMVPLISGAKMG